MADRVAVLAAALIALVVSDGVGSVRAGRTKGRNVLAS
jgi:hypothetical protein